MALSDNKPKKWIVTYSANGWVRRAGNWDGYDTYEEASIKAKEEKKYDKTKRKYKVELNPSPKQH